VQERWKRNYFPQQVARKTRGNKTKRGGEKASTEFDCFSKKGGGKNITGLPQYGKQTHTSPSVRRKMNKEGNEEEKREQKNEGREKI